MPSLASTAFLWRKIVASVLHEEKRRGGLLQLVDLVSSELRPIVGQIRSIATVAVLVCAATAAIIGLIIFVPYF